MVKNRALYGLNHVNKNKITINMQTLNSSHMVAIKSHLYENLFKWDNPSSAVTLYKQVEASFKPNKMPHISTK